MAQSTETVLIVPDAHHPYHNKRAWKLMLEAALDIKPDIVVVIGDLGDFYSINGHLKNPLRDRKLKWELTALKHALDDLEGLGAKRLIYIEGNHENRLTRFLMEKAPELFDVINLPDLLDLTTRGWEWVPYRSHIRIGKVYFTHDIGKLGRYAIFKNLDAFQHSIVTGHTHRMGYAIEGNLANEQHVAASFGWLGDITKLSEYEHDLTAKVSNTLGFGLGTLETTTGHMFLQPVPMVSYKCAVNGKIYKG